MVGSGNEEEEEDRELPNLEEALVDALGSEGWCVGYLGPHGEFRIFINCARGLRHLIISHHFSKATEWLNEPQ